MQLNSRDLAVPHWFAAQTLAGREQFCATQLQVRGYEVFLPSYRELRQWSDRVKTITRALFSGYLFCRIPADVVGKLVTTPGLVAVVGDGIRPLPVALHEITMLQKVVEAGVPAQPWEYVSAGQRVRLIAGPLRGFDGIVVKTRNGRRIVVSVSLLQRSVAVEIDAAWVRVTPAFTGDCERAYAVPIVDACADLP